MDSKNFIQIPSHNGKLRYVNISSIALVEDSSPNGTTIVLKERDSSGNNISFLASLPYKSVWEMIYNKDKDQY